MNKRMAPLTRKEALERARHDATLLNHINEADRLGLAADWIQMEDELQRARARVAELEDEHARIVREAVEEAARKAGHGGDMVVILSQEWEPGGHGAMLIRKNALLAALGVASEEKTG